MKKLHLVAGKDKFRPELKYIQIKGGFVYATNGIIFVKFPLEEVFGRNPPFSNEDEVYILADDWKRQNLFKGAYFSRKTLTVDWDYLEATNKLGSLIGRVKVYIVCRQLLNINEIFPDIDSIIPDSPLEPISMISFDPLQLKNLIASIGCDQYNYVFEFRGNEKVIIVKNLDSEAVAGILPMRIY